MTALRDRLGASTLAVLVLAVTATAFASAEASARGGGRTQSLPAPHGIHVSVRMSAHGIPHVIAGDYRSLGFGIGWAQQRELPCTLADAFMTVDALRSRYLGPSGSYDESYVNGAVPNNLQSDFFYEKLIQQHTVERLLDPRRTDAPLAGIRQIVDGYALGYDSALAAEHGAGGIRDPACRGQAWVRPISAIDVWRRIYQAALLASQGVDIDGINAAAPPGGSVLSSLQALRAQRAALPGLRSRVPLALTGAGSNAIALGAAATSDRHGMVLGNPHLPWQGPERMWEFQETVPGRLDVAGAGFPGIPAVLNGFDRWVAWSHTDSTARAFAPYQLSLVPGSPTEYTVDGQVHRMQATTVSVPVRKPDGSVGTQSHTFYDTDYGPVITSIAGLPLPWTLTNAYAMFDANAENLGRVANEFFLAGQARSVFDLNRADRRWQGMPWVNTIAADSRGDAYYTVIGSIPNIDVDRYSSCETPLGRVTSAQDRLPVLDGSKSSCAPGDAKGAADPGILPAGREPTLFRRDYVENSNDSPCLVNARHLQTGFSPIIGPQAQPQLFRTRWGIKSIEDRLDGRDGAPRTFTPKMLRDLQYSDADYEAQLWLRDAEAMCESHPTMLGSSGPVNVSAACPALHEYNEHADLNSRGYLLWRRFGERIWLNGESSNPWADSFDPHDPVNTPAKLNTSDSGVQKAFADAVSDLEAAHIPFDAPLGQYAYVIRNGQKLPLHGGTGVGLFNVIFEPFDPKLGYPGVQGGSTYIQVVRVTGGCPDAHTIETHSQSTDPTSPYYADQTQMYSRKQWMTFPFCQKAILHSRGLRITNFGGGYRPPKPRRRPR